VQHRSVNMDWEGLDLSIDHNELAKNTPQRLVQELKFHVQGILAESESTTSSKEHKLYLITKDTPNVLSFVYCLEQILSHGLKDVSFFGTTYLWNYLENIDKCLPGTQKTLKIVKELSKTDIGRGRTFIRVAMNEDCLAEYLNGLWWNKEITDKYYHDFALTRNEEQNSIVMMLLNGLAVASFRVYLKPREMDDEIYWDSVKLIKPVIELEDGTSAKLFQNGKSSNTTVGDPNMIKDNDSFLFSSNLVKEKKKQKREEKRKRLEEQEKKGQTRRRGTKRT